MPFTALTAFFCVFLVYRVMLMRDPTAVRMKAIAQRSQELRAGLALSPRRQAQREKSMTLMRVIVSKLNLLRSREADKAARNMAKAGWRSRDALTIFFFMKLCLPFVFGGIAVFLLYVVKIVDVESTQRLFIALGMVVVGAYGPEIYVRNTISKRQKLLQKGLPDALDLLVICAEAGQSLDAAMTRVAKELAAQAPELAEELSLTTVELGLLPERRMALDNLNERTDIPGIRGVVNTLHQSEKYGTPLAQSMRVLAAEFRNDRLMKAEAKAARLPAILTVPMMIFIMPPLFIVLIGPAILRVMDMFSKL